MSEPIKTGDWVIVVKPRECCDNPTDVGRIHRVTGLYHEGHCGNCNAPITAPVALLDGKWLCKALSRLKRIDPLTEPESAEHRKELERSA